MTLIEDMIAKAQEKIIDTNPDDTFKMGFHAIPSMAQVHMHVISQDFHSPCLKTKKHWNSFNTEYFIPVEKLLELLKNHGTVGSKIRQENKGELLKTDLQCNQCDRKAKNMPDLKSHLEKHLKL